MTTVSMAIANSALREEVHTWLEKETVQLDFEQAQTADIDPLAAAIERSRPDLVLIDVSTVTDPVREVIGRLRSAAPDSMIVALSSEASTESVLDCFRAGAAEYLFPPLEEGLRRAQERREAERSRSESGKPRGRLAVFLSAKGGCGATTLACHSASVLAALGRKTLLADLDTHAGQVSFLMKTKSPYSISDAVNNTHRLDVSYWNALVSNGGPGLDIISAPTAISGKQDMKLEEIRKVLGFAHTHYEWTVVDAGRGMTQATLTALEIADDACIVTTPEVPALQQTRQLLQRLLNSGYKQDRLKLILNRVPKRAAIRPEEVQSMLGIRLFASLPDSYPELHEACCQGELVRPETELGQQFGRLARKLDGKEERRSVKRQTPFQSVLARMRLVGA